MEHARLSLISYGSHKDKYTRARLQPGAEIPLHIPLAAGKVHIGTQASPTLISVTVQQIDAGISRTHCMLERSSHLSKPTWTLTDMSTNGTYLNGDRCEFGKAYVLPPLCEIVLGDPAVSALRYQFSTGLGIDLGKRTRTAGKATPVLVPADSPCTDEAPVDNDSKRLKPVTDVAFEEVRRRHSEFLAAVGTERFEDLLLCAYCRKPAVVPLDLPCRHTVCFLCFDSMHFQSKKRSCDICGREMEAYKLPPYSLTIQQKVKQAVSASAQALLQSAESLISQREVHILKTLRLREAGYVQSLRENQEPLYSPSLSPEYLDLFTAKLKSLSPAKRALLLRAKGLDEEVISTADEQVLSLVLQRLKVEDAGEGIDEKRAALLKLRSTRLSDYGRSILHSSLTPAVQSPGGDSGGVYPFWRPQQVNAPMQRYQSVPAFNTAELKSTLKQLEQEIDSRPARRAPMQLLGLKPMPQKPKAEDQYVRMMETMQEQQRTMSEVLRTMRRSPQAPQSVAPSPQWTSQKPKPEVLDETYQGLKSKPVKYHQFLESMGLDTSDDIPSVTSPKDPYGFLPAKTRKRGLPPPQPRLRGKRRLRSYFLAILFLIFTYSEILGKKRDRNATARIDMKKTIEAFMGAATNWTLRSIRVPITSVLNDSKLDLDITDAGHRKKDHTDKMSIKVTKLQVRVKGILEGLRDNTARGAMPDELCRFLWKIVSNDALLPASFLLGFEKSRLRFNAFGAVQGHTRETQMMMICMFFISRIVVGRLFLQKSYLHFEPDSKAAECWLCRNFRVIASVLELMALQAFARTNRSPQEGAADELTLRTRASGTPLPAVLPTQTIADGVSERLLTIAEMQTAYNAMGGWWENMRELMTVWTDSVLRLVNAVKAEEGR